MATSKVLCPECQEPIDLVPAEDNPKRLVAVHACKGMPLRVVYETDAPDFPPALLLDRLEQSEHASYAKKRRR